MTAKYAGICDSLIQRINNGTYPPGKMIPTERELTDEFGVTRMTIRRAIDEMINDGFLYRKPGSGAFVTERIVSRPIQHTSIHNDELLKQKYKKMTIRVISMTYASDKSIQRHVLGLSSSAKVYRLQRVQYGDDEPIVYEDIYLPKKLFPKLTKADCAVSMNEIVAKFGVFDSAAHKHEITVEAIAATPKVSSYLEMPVNSPVLQTHILVTNNGKPLYCGIDSYSGYKYNFVVL